MTFELTMANLISLAGLFLGAFWALLKVIALQAEKRSNEKFAALQAAIATVGVDMRREAEAARQLETSFLRFQAELPRDYVRRDDFVQASAASAPVSTTLPCVWSARWTTAMEALRNDHQLFRRSAQSAP